MDKLKIGSVVYDKDLISPYKQKGTVKKITKKYVIVDLCGLLARYTLKEVKFLTS